MDALTKSTLYILIFESPIVGNPVYHADSQLPNNFLHTDVSKSLILYVMAALAM